MMFERKVWICRQKAYLNKGLELLGYGKYLLVILALSPNGASTALEIAVIYAGLCYIAGWTWYRNGFTDAENEVGNRFNPFVKEVRAANPFKLMGSRLQHGKRSSDHRARPG
jgi:hypothetical protein